MNEISSNHHWLWLLLVVFCGLLQSTKGSRNKCAEKEVKLGNNKRTNSINMQVWGLTMWKWSLWSCCQNCFKSCTMRKDTSPHIMNEAVYTELLMTNFKTSNKFLIFLFLERKRANCFGGYGLTAIGIEFGWFLPTLVVVVGAQLIWRGHQWFHFLGLNIRLARTETVESLCAQRRTHWPSRHMHMNQMWL